jgi:mRNA-degrading endonuclease toxin of MazEF toxin-antitoxin module
MEVQAQIWRQTMRQYEIWWAALPSPAGRRPVLLLSRDLAYEFLTNVLAVEITTTIRGIPQEVSLGRREGLPARCVANFYNLHSVRRATLEGRLGVVAKTRIAEVKRALGHALGWPELTLPD